MTYADLRRYLFSLSDEQLNMDLTIYLSTEDEYYPAEILICNDSEGVLDDNHPLFVIREEDDA